MINVHTHNKYLLPGTLLLRNLCLGFGHRQLRDISYMVSAGFHPWHINRINLTEISDELIRINQYKQVVAVGEIGLDKTIQTNMKQQFKVFDIQFTVARALSKPLIIHCVKAQGELLPVLKKSSVPYVIHGFNGNIQQAQQWLNAGANLSVGKVVFNESFEQVVKHIPLQNLFLETDTWPGSIQSIYHKVAQIKSLSTDELVSVINNNFAQVFKIKFNETD